MSGNVGQFSWTRKREEAALLVAADELTNEQIADQLAITDRTLLRWKLEPAFKERVAEHVAAWRAEIRKRGITERQNRVDALNSRWEAMQLIVTERAVDMGGRSDEGVPQIPGGSSGLLVRQFKVLGAGRNARFVEEYAVDVGLLRELRAHEEQAAKELGQWQDKLGLTGDLLIREYVGVPVDEV